MRHVTYLTIRWTAYRPHRASPGHHLGRHAGLRLLRGHAGAGGPSAFPGVRDAAVATVFDQAGKLETDIKAAIDMRRIEPSGWNAASLGHHFQAVLRGGFIRVKARNDPDLARESVDHLDRYVRALFGVPAQTPDWRGTRPCNPTLTSSSPETASSR
jgi:hypothetical protein